MELQGAGEHELIEGGPNVKDRQGYTLLHRAVLKGHLHLIEELGQHSGLKPNTRNRQGYAPLHLACLRDQPETIAALARLPGIDMNVGNHEGNTPLHLAACFGHTQSVACLLGYLDVDLCARNARGEHAEQVIVRSACTQEKEGQEKAIRACFVQGRAARKPPRARAPEVEITQTPTLRLALPPQGTSPAKHTAQASPPISAAGLLVLLLCVLVAASWGLPLSTRSAQDLGAECPSKEEDLPLGGASGQVVVQET